MVFGAPFPLSSFFFSLFFWGGGGGGGGGFPVRICHPQDKMGVSFFSTGGLGLAFLPLWRVGRNRLPHGLLSQRNLPRKVAGWCGGNGEVQANRNSTLRGETKGSQLRSQKGSPKREVQEGKSKKGSPQREVQRENHKGEPSGKPEDQLFGAEVSGTPKLFKTYHREIIPAWESSKSRRSDGKKRVLY